MSRFQVGLGDATSDLGAFNSTISAGDQYLSGGEYANAVQAYKAGGQGAATTLGPEVNTQTQNASTSIVQQASALNTQLQAITGTAQSDATNAQSLAKQMAALYQQGLNTSPPPPPNFPTPIENAMQALLAYLQTNGCTTNAFQACTDFQNAFNEAGGTPPLVVTGKYGPEEQDALQAVILQLGTAGQQAPAACVAAASGTTVAPESLPPVKTAGTAPRIDPGLVVAGAVVVAAGLVGYALWTKHHRRKGT